jgi:hypothetical protein
MKTPFMKSSVAKKIRKSISLTLTLAICVQLVLPGGAVYPSFAQAAVSSNSIFFGPQKYRHNTHGMLLFWSIFEQVILF